jgi:WD40 repeat protein
MVKKNLMAVLLVLAVFAGSALSPLLIELAAVAQQGIFPGDIASHVAADIVPLHVFVDDFAEVNEVVFSPDSQKIAVAFADGMVRIWDVNNGELLFTLKAHNDQVRSLDFSPDGTQLATGGDDETLKQWDMQNGSEIRSMGTTLAGRILKVKYSPDGSMLAAGGHFCNVELRLVATGLRTRTLPLPECGLSRGGSAKFFGMDYSLDGTQMYIGVAKGNLDSGSILLWDITTYVNPVQIKLFGLEVRDLALSSDGQTMGVALVGSSAVRLLSLEDRLVDYVYDGHIHRVNSVAFSPDDRLLVSGSRDSSVRIWDTGTGLQLRVLDSHNDTVNSVAFSPDGGLIASADIDGMVIVWALGSE